MLIDNYPERRDRLLSDRRHSRPRSPSPSSPDTYQTLRRISDGPTA
ncbi:MAG: hypothetical protein HC910_15965 [Spirulinaceae cyanobacterium SM2_1_0]|nr:hypothetical protein [Spirulinaceae cyanobacterium SM2_1_0]